MYELKEYNDIIALQKMVEKGVDANILCYDSDQIDENLTLRLIHTMKGCMRAVYGEKLKTLYIPRFITFTHDYQKKQERITNECLSEYDIDFVTIPNLNEYYLSLGAIFPYGKYRKFDAHPNLIIGLSQTHNEVLLGCH